MIDNRFRRKLNSDEMQTIKTLQNEGFSKLDTTIIYKIVVHFQGLIPPPTRNWGSNPQAHEIDTGDDVERIRIKRNGFAHQVFAEISEQDMNEFFVTSIEIGKRIDKYLNKTGENRHEKKIKDYQKCPMEPGNTDRYIRDLQEIESFKGMCSCYIGILYLITFSYSMNIYLRKSSFTEG